MKRRASRLIPTCLTLSLQACLGACSAAAPGDDASGGAATGGAGGAAFGVAGTTAAAAGGAAGGAGGAATGGTGAAGSGAASGGTPGGGSPRANYGSVREVVSLVCGDSSCHGGEHKLFMRDDEKLYSTLTTYVSGGCGARVLVKPGFPEESAFALVLKGACGTIPRMPNGCVPGETCIPDDYIEGAWQWIASGALE